MQRVSPAAVGIAFLTLTACRGSSPISQPLLLGSYEGRLADPANPQHPEQSIRMTFFADGNFLETQRLYQSPSPFKGAVLASPGQGMWTATGARQGKAVFSIDLFLVGGAADGTLLANETVTFTFDVDPKTNTVTGPWKAVVRSAENSAVLATTAGSISARVANRP